MSNCDCPDCAARRKGYAALDHMAEGTTPAMSLELAAQVDAAERFLMWRHRRGVRPDEIN